MPFVPPELRGGGQSPMVGPGSTQLDVDRKRALAKALLAQQMPQGQMAGRFYVAPSPWAQAAAGFANALGQYQSGKADELQQGVDKELQRKIAEALVKQSGGAIDPESLGPLSLDQSRALYTDVMSRKLAPKPASTRAPVTVRGADGKPRYENAEDAVGKEPYFDPGQAPGKVREFQFAQQNGYKGNYDDFLKIDQAGIGTFNPGDYTPDSFAKFQQTRDPLALKRYVAPAPQVIKDVNNVPTAINAPRGGGTVTMQPLSTLPQVASSAQTVKAAEAEGAATGKAAGEAYGAAQSKALRSEGVVGLLDLADPLIDVATGSKAGATYDQFAAAFGGADAGAQAIGKLKVLEAGLIADMPRLEGPQSDRDVLLYKEAAAQIGNPEVPRDIKRAALQTIRDIQARYPQAFAKMQQQAPQRGPSAADFAGATRGPPASDFSGVSDDDLLRQLGQ